MVSDSDRNIRLPPKSWDYRTTKFYLDKDPIPDYKHASEEAHEAFRDIKFAVHIY